MIINETFLSQFHAELPVFPLDNALVLPHTHLPLTIFEPRYIDMVNATLSQHRLMVIAHPLSVADEDETSQSDDEDEDAADDLSADHATFQTSIRRTEPSESPKTPRFPPPTAAGVGEQPPMLHNTGCIGQIVRFEDHEGTYGIVLKGLIRCNLRNEVPSQKRYRSFIVDTHKYQIDLSPTEHGELTNREPLLTAFKEYLQSNDVKADWNLITRLPDWVLVNSIAISCPFETTEQQAFLQIVDFNDRAHTLEALLRMFNAASGRTVN